jgi:hypothetical protein
MDGLFLTRLSSNGAGVASARPTSVAIRVGVPNSVVSTNRVPVAIIVGDGDHATVAHKVGLGTAVGLVGPGIGEAVKPTDGLGMPWGVVVVGVTIMGVGLPGIVVEGTSTVGDCRGGADVLVCVGDCRGAAGVLVRVGGCRGAAGVLVRVGGMVLVAVATLDGMN